jgi:hypothetical protein
MRSCRKWRDRLVRNERFALMPFDVIPYRLLLFLLFAAQKVPIPIHAFFVCYQERHYGALHLKYLGLCNTFGELMCCRWLHAYVGKINKNTQPIM